MMKITAILASAALASLDAPLPQIQSPVKSADMQVSFLSIATSQKGVQAEITDTSDFCFNVVLQNGHRVKVSF